MSINAWRRCFRGRVFRRFGRPDGAIVEKNALGPPASLGVFLVSAQESP